MKLIQRYFILIVLISIPIWLMYEFILLYRVADIQIKSAYIGVFGITSAAIAAHLFTKSRDIDSRHFSQKSEVYIKILDLISTLIINQRNNRQINKSDIIDQATKIKMNLMIWAGPDVLKAWSDFEKSDGESSDTQLLLSMDKVIRALRKDLGHRDVSIKDNYFIKFIIKHEDHHELDKPQKKV